jgi:glycosyltransferase involved in cell wall biosynthesis
MKTLFLKDSSNRRKQFALTTRICVENGKKVVIKEPSFPEGIPHIKKIVESQRLFAQYYKNVEISKTWIKNDMLYAEFIDGMPLSDLYINAIQNNDKDEIIKLIKYHLTLALGQNNTCTFKSTDDFVNLFGKSEIFKRNQALIFTFFDPLPENIIFRNGDINRPCFIDYEWFFDFPIPVSILKFRIAQQLSMLAGMDDIIPLKERLAITGCKFSFNDGIIFFDKFSDFVYKENSILYSFLNKDFEKSILHYPDIVTYSGTIYFDAGNGFSEKVKLAYSFARNEVEVSCQIPENAVSARLDPVEGHGCVISNLEILSYGGIVKYEPINGFMDKAGDLVFTNTDPQISLHGAAYWLKIKYRILLLSEFSHYRVLDDYIATTWERDGLVAERDGLLNSRSWRFTRPLRKFTAFVRKNRLLYLFAKGIVSLKRRGIKGTVKKVRDYIYNRRQLLTQLATVINETLPHESEYQENTDFSGHEPKVKAIAFYLPQFHRIPENDKWWGKGFTEWTNTRKTKPRFKGHYQPREPHKDIGYYDLANVETLKKQAALAKQHGIYGFCFYLYWFSGKRLLEKPLDLFLEHPEIDINFCLCWANENWTRRWDGMDHEVLIKQNYTEDDPYRFIEDIQKYVIDKRYIRIDGIPVILVYNPSHIPNVRDVFIKWKKKADEIGIGQIKIWMTSLFGHTAESLNITDIVDAEVEFPPNINVNLKNKTLKKTTIIYDYKDVITAYEQRIISAEKRKIPLYRSCMLAWDNTPRKASEWTTFAGFSLKSFYKWASTIVDESREPFMFINAWNEWAEGTYLEPDKKYGYANINTLSKAIFGLEFDGTKLRQSVQGYKPENKGIIFVGHDAHQNGAQVLALNIIRQLAETFKYDVYLILKSGGPLLNDFDEIAIETICLDNSGEKNLKEWIKSINVDKAICNTVLSGDILHMLAECGVVCISLIHEMEKVIRQYSCENNLSFIAQDASKIVFASDYVRKSVENIVSIPKEKTIISSQGLGMINPYFENHETMCASIRKKHNLPKNSKIVLGVGYGDYRKGLDLFAQCMLKVCKSCENTYFIWVGNIENNILLKVNSLLEGHEMKNRFITTGWEKEYMRYYAAANVYLLTSREDPFPSVVLEAMHSYLPVIAFENGGGYVEIVDDNTGGLVPMENVEFMSERIIRLLNDDDLRLKIGKYAHNLVEKKYHFVAYIYSLLKLLGTDYKKISVIIPNYNYARYLRERIESILLQTYPVFEIIILDDCSTDESLEIIDEYAKRIPLRIKVIKNEKNCGKVFKQWVKGIEIAKGDYVWIAEADDLSEPTFLETIIKGMSLDENIVMGYSQSKIIDEYGKNIGDNYLFYTDEIDTIWENDYIADGKEEIEKRLSVKNTILNVSAAVFRKDKLLAAVNNTKNYNVAGDWRFYVDLLKEGGKISFIADNLNIHRRHTNSVTKNLNTQKHFDEICEIQEYVYKLTSNSKYYNRAKKYREELKVELGLK